MTFQDQQLNSMTFPGLEKNEVLKFYDFPGFPWLNRTNPAMCFFIFHSDLPLTLQSRYDDF